MPPPHFGTFKKYSNLINGRIAMRPEEYELFQASIPDGCLYVEIGTLWGGSAILAALQADHVICIDPMKEYQDAAFNYKSPPTGIVLDNFHKAGVAHKISIVRARSDPFPLPEDVHPDVMYIDGDHSFNMATLDWRVASRITKSVILCHDYVRSTPGVQRMVNEIAKRDPDWVFDELVATMVKFTRRDNGK